LKLLTIRNEIEKSLLTAVPGWKLFSANTLPATDEDYPCINTFFDKDRLLNDEGPIETRGVGFEIEAGFNVTSGDPERDLIELRQRIEYALETNGSLKNLMTKMRFIEVEFATAGQGDRSRAYLFMKARIQYQKPRASPPPPVVSPDLVATINGVKQTDG
jgi:hypothetical protein